MFSFGSLQCYSGHNPKQVEGFFLYFFKKISFIFIPFFLTPLFYYFSVRLGCLYTKAKDQLRVFINIEDYSILLLKISMSGSGLASVEDKDAFC